jgi:hypothetical protein
MKTKLGALTFALVSLSLAACGVAASPTPTVTPEVFMPATRVAPKGPMISGHVLWGTTPVAGARVELRTGAWADPQAGETIAQTVADETGAYKLEAPPAGGEFGLVAGWPDGGANRAPVTPVQVSGGVALDATDVYLAKALAPQEPAPGAQVGATPTLSWEGLVGVAQYRVWVIDAGTTEAVVDEVTTGTRLTVSAPLKAGRTYQWVVNGLAADQHLLASLTGEFTVAAQAGALPPTR